MVLKNKKKLLLFLVVLFLIPTSLAIYRQKFSKNVNLNISDSTYTIIFNGNNSTGGQTADKQCKYGRSCTLNANGFTRTGYTFTGWSTDPDGPVEYTDQESVSNLVLSGTITLYAQWSVDGASEYGITYHYGDMAFNGAKYLDTDLPLFSQANYNKTTHEYKDFEINFDIDSATGIVGDQGVLAMCMDEYHTQTYPGFTYRYYTNPKYNFSTYVNGSTGKDSQDFTGSSIPSSVKIERIDNHMYVNNTMNSTDFDQIAQNFDVSLRFGAGLQSNGTARRFFIGELSNITTKLMYDAGQVTLPTPSINSTEGYIFRGWNTKADGTGTYYSSVNLSADMDLYAIWDVIEYTITVSNNGPSNATGIIVNDVLPDGVTYVSDDSEGSYDPQTGVWSFDSLKANETKTLTIKVKVNRAGEITNVVDVKSRENPEGTTGNSTINAKDSKVDLVIAKTVSTTKAYVGDIIVYTITIVNRGTTDATGVLVYEDLLVGLKYLSDDGNGQYDFDIGIWNIGTLKSGETRVLNIVVEVTKAGNISNFVFIVCNQDIIDVNSSYDNVTVEVFEHEKPIDNASDNATAKEFVVDSKATGNPFVVLLIALMIAGVGFRRRK